MCDGLRLALVSDNAWNAVVIAILRFKAGNSFTFGQQRRRPTLEHFELCICRMALVMVIWKKLSGFMNRQRPSGKRSRREAKPATWTMTYSVSLS